MNTDQLQVLLKRNARTWKHFRGMYAYDQLPKKGKVGYYIVNLDPITQPGSHWIALRKRPGARATHQFFDSYGLPPQKLRFKRFLNNKYTFNSKNLQYPTNTSCGQWCLYFIYCSCMGHSMQKMFKHFSAKT